MTIDAPCPNCGTIYTVRRDLIGKRTKCTRCGTPFVITEVPLAQPPRPTAPPPQEQPAFGDIPIHQTFPPRQAPEVEPQRATQASGTRQQTANYLGFDDKSKPRFPALKMVARGYEVLAVIVLAVAAIMLIVGIVSVIANPHAIVSVLVSSGMMVVWGLATALMCLFFAQVTRLALQVEQNTRQTSEACRQLAEHLGGIQVVK